MLVDVKWPLAVMRTCSPDGIRSVAETVTVFPDKTLSVEATNVPCGPADGTGVGVSAGTGVGSSGSSGSGVGVSGTGVSSGTGVGVSGTGVGAEDTGVGVAVGTALTDMETLASVLPPGTVRTLTVPEPAEHPVTVMLPLSVSSGTYLPDGPQLPLETLPLTWNCQLLVVTLEAVTVVDSPTVMDESETLNVAE